MVEKVTLWHLLKAARGFRPKKPWIIFCQLWQPAGYDTAKVIHIPGHCTERMCWVLFVDIVFAIVIAWIISVQYIWAIAAGFLVLLLLIELPFIGERILAFEISEGGIITFSRCSFVCRGENSICDPISIPHIQSVTLSSEARIGTKNRSKLAFLLRGEDGHPLRTCTICRDEAEAEVLLFAIHSYLRTHVTPPSPLETHSFYLTPRSTKSCNSCLLWFSTCSCKTTKKICGSLQWRKYFQFVNQYLFCTFCYAVATTCYSLAGGNTPSWQEFGIFCGYLLGVFFVFCNFVPVGSFVYFVDNRYFLISKRYPLFRWSTRVSSESLQSVCFDEETVENPSLLQRINPCNQVVVETKLWMYFLHGNTYDRVIFSGEDINEFDDRLVEACEQFEAQTLQLLCDVFDDCGFGIGDDVVKEIVCFVASTNVPPQEEAV